MQIMSTWGIHGFQPRWLTKAEDLRDALRVIQPDFVGRPIRAVWTLWDSESDDWWNDGPVIIDTGSCRLEVCAHKLDEMSISVNTIDISKPVFWCGEEQDGEPALRWTTRIHSCLAGIASQRIEGFCIMEYRLVPDLEPMLNLNWVVAGIGFELENDYFEVSNGLDCNALSRSRTLGEDNRYRQVGS